MRRFSIRPSPATALAVVALFVALSSTSIAAPLRDAATRLITGAQVKDGSLTGKDLRDGSVGSADVANGGLLALDFKKGQLPAGAPGVAGPKGDKGDAGSKGDKGDAGATNVSVKTATGPAAAAGVNSVATALCDAGQKVVGGGVAYSRVPPGEPSTWASFPSGGSPETGWTVSLKNDGAGGSVSAVAYVVCAAP
jgi:hypothetical protein